MQSQDQNSRNENAVNHPGAAEWMAFHYGEVPAEQKRQLRAHLAQCAACRQQNQAWAQGIAALDEWKLPAPLRSGPRWQPMPMLKWAAAAALVLAIGFAIGRQSSKAAGEIASLKDSVGRLARMVEHQRATNGSDEVAPLLADYSKLNEEQRTQDRKAIGLALRDMETRIVKLRAELETVAVNTESGFRQTREGINELASFAAADQVDQSQVSNPKSTNQ